MILLLKGDIVLDDNYVVVKAMFQHIVAKIQPNKMDTEFYLQLENNRWLILFIEQITNCIGKWAFPSTRNIEGIKQSLLGEVAMGSPLSAVIASLSMVSFKEQAITTSSYKPRNWKQYVDDTFTILDQGSLGDFVQYLSNIINQQPSIHLTIETENNNKLAFLDIPVSREPDSHLTTSVYRKPTHTDQYNTTHNQ